MTRAGPDRKTLPSQRTVCAPPGVCTLTGDRARPEKMAATAEAHDPVPEERVSPTPRSKKNACSASALATFTN